MRFIALFLLISFNSFSQDTTKYFKSNDYGWNWQRGKFRASLIIPNDTTNNKLGIAQIGNNFYVYNNRWVAVGVNLGVQAPLLLSNNTISISQASNTTNGFLSSTDWATFNSKLSSINSSMVTSALGYTPYNATNPSGYITSSALSPYLLSSTAATTYLPLTGGTLTSRLNGTSLSLNKDSLPITTSRIWGVVIDTSNGNRISRQILPTASNPIATIGLTATNGTATTFMRSDAAPSLDQSISPTWTGTHSFNRSLTGSQANGNISINNTWFTSGNPVALGINITNTASGTSARAVDVNIGANNIFNISAGGVSTFNSVSSANNSLAFDVRHTNTSMFQVNNLGARANVYTAISGGISIMTNPFSVSPTGTQLTIGSYNAFGTTGVNMVLINPTYTTQSTAVNNTLALTPTLNLNASTTSASIQRGLFYNPTITALQSAQHRAIETTTGDIVLGSTSGNLSFGSTGSFGGGSKVVFIANATTTPTTNPTGGGILFVEGGALKYRGSSGTITTIANP